MIQVCPERQQSQNAATFGKVLLVPSPYGDCLLAYSRQLGHLKITDHLGSWLKAAVVESLGTEPDYLERNSSFGHIAGAFTAGQAGGMSVLGSSTEVVKSSGCSSRWDLHTRHRCRDLAATKAAAAEVSSDSVLSHLVSLCIVVEGFLPSSSVCRSWQVLISGLGCAPSCALKFHRAFQRSLQCCSEVLQRFIGFPCLASRCPRRHQYASDAMRSESPLLPK